MTSRCGRARPVQTNAKAFGIVIGLAFVCGCVDSNPAAPDLLAELTTDGRTVRELLSPASRTALLVYDPATCLGCNSSLAAWEASARGGHVVVALLLTRAPTAEQTRTLRNQRVQYAAVLRYGWTPAPAEYVFNMGHEVARAEGRSQINSLRLWEWAADSSSPWSQRGAGNNHDR